MPAARGAPLADTASSYSCPSHNRRAHRQHARLTALESTLLLAFHAPPTRAQEHGLQVLPAEECAPGRTPPHTLEGHDFYLVALRKK